MCDAPAPEPPRFLRPPAPGDGRGRGGGWLRPFLLLLLVADARGGDRAYDFQEKRLANGLRVLTLERHSCPIVAVQVWYHVGSKDERPDRQGFAHLFEHMMFRGTDYVGPYGHAELIRSVGGHANARTFFDVTYFDNKLPSNQLELALWLEAERMAFLRIDEGGFHTERKVVEEESRQNFHVPYGLVASHLLAGIIREHPYRWPSIGSIAHLRAATLEEVDAFWARYYLPCNAVLVIVGDIEHAKAQSLAERYFGWIPGGTSPARTSVVEPPQGERRDLRIPEGTAKMPVVGVVVRTPAADHPDALPLNLLVWILAERYPSRLYTDLMWDQQIAHDVWAFPALALEEFGLRGVAAQLDKPGEEDRALRAIEAQLDKIAETPVTDQEIETGRRWLRCADATARSTASSTAFELAWAAILGDAESVNRRAEAIRAVTAADLLRVARTYFAVPKRTRFRVEPGAAPGRRDEGAEPPAPADGSRVARRTGPKAELRRPASFPTAPPLHPTLPTFPTTPQSRRRLDNGMEIVVVRNHDVPLVECTLSLRFGSMSEEKPGAAHLAALVLTRRTAKRNGTELLHVCEREGLSFQGEAEHDTASVSTRCLSGQVDTVLELLAEMAMFPKVTQGNLDAARETLMRTMEGRRRRAWDEATAALARHVYGNHPYGRRPTAEIGDVRRLERQDLVDWWGRFGRPDAAVLYVAGDVEPDAVFRSAQEQFGAWKAEGRLPEPVTPPLPALPKRSILILNRPGSVQSDICAGHAAITRSHADWAGARLLGAILGGSPVSRLATTVRREGGLAYDVAGGFAGYREAGLFWVRVSTETPRTAETVRAVLGVVERLRAEGPTQNEIDEARNLLAGTLVGEWETAQGVVEDLRYADIAGLPPDFMRSMVQAFGAARPEELRRIAKTHIDPDALVIVVVGDATRIHAELEKIAPVTVY